MLKKKIIIRLLLFLIGFVFIDQTIGSVLIAPYPYNRQAKSDEKNESYHTIFIGASKILVGIDPAIIEEYWEAGGGIQCRHGIAAYQCNFLLFTGFDKE